MSAAGAGTGARPWLRSLCALALAAALAGGTGCWDRQEMEQLAFVVSLGLDRGPHGDLLVTFRVLRPAGAAGGGGAGMGGGGGGGSGPPVVETTVEAPSIMAAESLADTYFRRRVVLDQAAAIVIGLPLAEAGVTPYLDELVRHREVRRTALLLVGEPTAESTIEKTQPPLDTNPVSFIQDLRHVQETEGWLPPSTLQSFAQGVESSTGDAVAALTSVSPQAQSGALLDQPLAPGEPPYSVAPQRLPRTGSGNPVNVMGAVAFRDARAVGTLTGAQTVILNMINGHLGRTVFTLPDPYRPSATDNIILAATRKPKVLVDPLRAGPRIKVEVPLEASVEFDAGPVDYALDATGRARLERALQQDLSAQADALFTLARSRWQADIFGFGNHVRGRFWTRGALARYNWFAQYPKASADMVFEVELNLVGPQLHPPVPGRSVAGSQTADNGPDRTGQPAASSSAGAHP